ncbi:unnamed protein product [Cyprideis torosa]|uniref:Uncharacterized protein n=1 Tax=Cyprideis torosa TaxID=163714 RepID=A0A7R8WUW7_9CRUS|nr:unnamed protein product [Cyprideis torosa]CAG0906792.1 unnamed protein product [Cyprideis torosa]
MLFVEGNHVCPGCEKSGACQLQAVAYYVEMLSPHYTHFFPRRAVDASHPGCIIDFNRCILCELCVRASREVDQKNVFAISGRGIKAHLTVNSPSGQLGDSDFAVTDKAAKVCPVGAILPKQIGYRVPIGERLYDKQAIDQANGRTDSSCTLPASPGLEVESHTDEIQQQRKSLLQMLFVEGNHVCPGCEKSGACQLQAVAYYVEMLSPHYTHFFPRRAVDASHPDCIIDFNRCILCELCVRASREVDQKNVFAISGRGIKAHLTVNSPSGQLGDSDFAVTDKAAQVCPVGAILPKQIGYRVPIGERLYDKQAIDQVGDANQPYLTATKAGESS